MSPKDYNEKVSVIQFINLNKKETGSRLVPDSCKILHNMKKVFEMENVYIYLARQLDRQIDRYIDRLDIDRLDIDILQKSIYRERKKSGRWVDGQIVAGG